MMSLISLKIYLFRLYRHELNTLTCVIPELDEGNTSPACPKVLKMKIFNHLKSIFWFTLIFYCKVRIYSISGMFLCFFLLPVYGRKVTINFCWDFFQTVGAVFESFDALFIGRRKNAGQSTGSPLFGELMFYNQQNVDQFVAQYSPPAAQTEVNKDFLLFLFSHFRFTVGLTYE